MKPINYLLFMGDLKLYGASKDQLDSLVQVVRIFLQDIKMAFGLDKCAVLEMRRGRQVGSSGIQLPDDQPIGEIEEEGYKYLGILQLDQTLTTKMKGKITSKSINQSVNQIKYLYSACISEESRSCVDQNSMEEI